MSHYGAFARDHAYARKNGYKGNYEEYVRLLYSGYVEVMKENKIKPMPFAEWRALTEQHKEEFERESNSRFI